MKKLSKKCAVCKKNFTPKTKRDICCSNECQSVRNKNQAKAYRLKHKEKLKAQVVDWKKKNNSKVNGYNKKRKDRAANFILGYFEKKQCVHCGIKDIRLFELDHIDPKTKHDCISNLVGQGRSLKVIREELEKCQILCANCHRLKTYKERGITKFNGYLPLNIDVDKGE